MKIIEVLRIASLFLLPGAIASGYAQEQHEQEKQAAPKQQQARPAQQQAKPAQQQQRAQQPAKPAQQQAKPAQQQQHAQQQAKPAQQQQRAQQQAKPAQQQQHAQQQAKPAQQQQHAQQQAKPAQQQARPAAQQQQANRAQPAAHGQIPDDRFRASFGRGHTFHVAQSAGGSRRFQYGGYWFAMGNPWPVGWLYTDNVYVDYMNGGYFLCDPVHPGVYLSITIG
jgi:hypothetical protein